jgi:hypothetical protein
MSVCRFRRQTNVNVVSTSELGRQVRERRHASNCLFYLWSTEDVRLRDGTRAAAKVDDSEPGVERDTVFYVPHSPTAALDVPSSILSRLAHLISQMYYAGLFVLVQSHMESHLSNPFVRTDRTKDGRPRCEKLRAIVVACAVRFVQRF